MFQKMIYINNIMGYRGGKLKLIVGLGNPGREYENTRHNVGFMVLDYYSKLINKEFNKEKFNGVYFDTIINGEKVVFLKPLSYMNLSGEVVYKFVDYFNIDISDIMIIHDDLDLEIGKYKLKYKGSSGGHNGLKNIELHLKTNIYKRWKIGISNNKNIDTKDYVLGKFSKDDKELLNEIIKLSSSLIPDFIDLDFDKLMNKYHN